LEVAWIAERCRRNLFNDELTDFHLGKKADWILGEVDHLERNRAFEAGMNRRCGEMNEKTDACKGTPAFNACGVAGTPLANRQINTFEGLAEDEFVWFEGISAPLVD